jgi:16S rRNA (adenine1518-N6/adenine1519-N6)-dimethyltransferase
MGTLTWELCQRAAHVVAVEIDKTLLPVLDYTLADFENLTVINADILKTDINALIEREFYSRGIKRVAVCANLPYYITTPIIMKLLEESRVDGKSMFTSLTVMVQKEVADRLCATEKDSEYGAITASLNYYGKVKKLFTVAPGNFLPAPSVTSAVIRIELYESNPYTVKSEKMLFETITGAFAQRRKTMLNSLASTMSFVSKERIGQIINEIGFDANIRGEKLSISDFCALADKLYEEKTK